MNYLPPILLPVKQLVLPGDIKARQQRPHVIELAESIRERTGKRPIHLPTIEYPSKELIAGRDRIAACLLNGNKSVWVQPVSQLTPADRRNLERDENLHRRVEDRDKLIHQRVEEREAEIEAQRILAQADEPKKPGRPKSAKGEAREQVARELGTTPDAVRVAEARAVAAHVHDWKEVEDEDDGVTHACACGETRGTDPVTGKAFGEELANKSSETLAPPVETYGLPVLTLVEAEELRDVQDAVDAADAALRRAQASLRSVEGAPLFRGAQQLLAQVHEAAAAVRRARPAAVCPYCKRLPHFVAGCSGCGASGFVGADAMLGVADELKVGGDKAMVVALGGRMVSYAYALTGKQPTGLAAAEPSIAGKGPATGTPRPAAASSSTGKAEEPHPIDRHLARAAKAKAPAKKTVTVVDQDNKPIVVDLEVTEEELPF